MADRIREIRTRKTEEFFGGHQDAITDAASLQVAIFDHVVEGAKPEGEKVTVFFTAVKEAAGERRGCLQ